MSSETKSNLSCPICHEIFQHPVLLLCGHSFCKACWQRWWAGTPTVCPVCKRESSLFDPPQNLALKNVCEDFLLGRPERASSESGELCPLHYQTLKLFCLNDQQLVCVVCLHSETHKNHSIRPIIEAARDYKEVLRVLLKPLQEKLELFSDIKRNIDQTAKDIELQAQDTERQINDVFSMLKKILQKEEQTRIDAVRTEKQQKSLMMKRKNEALNRDINALSSTVSATEDALRSKDLMFLKNYNTATKAVSDFKLNDPQLIAGGLIDMDKHLNNLSFNILDKMKTEVTHNLQPQKTNPDPRILITRKIIGLRVHE